MLFGICLATNSLAEPRGEEGGGKLDNAVKEAKRTAMEVTITS